MTLKRSREHYEPGYWRARRHARVFAKCSILCKKLDGLIRDWYIVCVDSGMKHDTVSWLGFISCSLHAVQRRLSTRGPPHVVDKVGQVRFCEICHARVETGRTIGGSVQNLCTPKCRDVTILIGKSNVQTRARAFCAVHATRLNPIHAHTWERDSKNVRIDSAYLCANVARMYDIEHPDG